MAAYGSLPIGSCYTKILGMPKTCLLVFGYTVVLTTLLRNPGTSIKFMGCFEV